MTSEVRSALEGARTSSGVSVAELSRGRGVLVVFLRHSGCTFCREALADLARVRSEIERGGALIALVHMGEESAETARFFGRYGLGDLPRVSDPGRELYRALGLRRGRFGQLFGIACWVRAIRAGVFGGHWVGKLVGDGFQMPGVFLVRDGRVERSFVHESAADRPDYPLVACGPGVACPAGAGDME
jgi:peroxiredoxin